MTGMEEKRTEKVSNKRGTIKDNKISFYSKEDHKNIMKKQIQGKERAKKEIRKKLEINKKEPSHVRKDKGLDKKE